LDDRHLLLVSAIRIASDYATDISIVDELSFTPSHHLPRLLFVLFPERRIAVALVAAHYGLCNGKGAVFCIYWQSFGAPILSSNQSTLRDRSRRLRAGGACPG